MLLRCKCPGCGSPKQYIAEEVGKIADCHHCGQQFALKANPGRAASQIIAATLAVLVLVVGFSARLYWRAKRSENRHNAAVRSADQHRFAATDERDD
jgi:hypothetical protein